MSAAGIGYGLLDGRAARARHEDLLALYREVFERTGDPQIDRRLRVWSRQPGFVLAEARNGGYLVGYAEGMPLRPSTDWWRHLTTPLPAEVTAERPGRTFALTALLVRASWRRQGIARGLTGLILAERPEERAAVTVEPDATAAQRALRSWGWRKVGRTRGYGERVPVLDVLSIDLPFILKDEGRRE